MADISLTNISKLFGSVKAVDQLNLSIKDGEFFALLGPSGCGKTTTLRMIAGLEVPTQGSIHIGNREVTDLPARDRDVAMVFQDYALYPHMTLLDNIGYPLKVRRVGKNEIQSRVGEVAKNLGIGQLLARRPGQLSGGQQQRAALARAIVHHAQVFLFDEPLSNLDAKLRLEARGFLKHLQQEIGTTSVYVTHDQAEAMALADRIAIMDQGKVVQVGTPLDVYRKPATIFVATFLGSPPMSLLECRLDLPGKRVQFDSSSFSLEGLPKWETLASQLNDGDALLMGMRPENISLLPAEAPQSFPGDVYAIQPLGSEVLVLLKVGDQTVSVRLFTDEPPQLSNRVWLQPDAKRLFFYSMSGDLVA
jgi:ABC-type sugar transport system ATPase subunit